MGERLGALVSGASRGLGRALSIELVREGLDVFGTARDEAGLIETARACDGPGNFTYGLLDLRNESAIAELVAIPQRLSICMVNAGVAAKKPFLESAGPDLMAQFEVNVLGALALMRECALRLSRQGGGRIVTIASDAAVKGIPGMAAYVASKHAVLGLSRTLDLELSPVGIQVTTVFPGPIGTNILGPIDPDATYMEVHEAARTIVVTLLACGNTTRVSELHLTPWRDPTAIRS
jgi:NAD(P)-dependent dehydrogenase (short-subunit alcohol dehydrogenase family)